MSVSSGFRGHAASHLNKVENNPGSFLMSALGLHTHVHTHAHALAHTWKHILTHWHYHRHTTHSGLCTHTLLHIQSHTHTFTKTQKHIDIFIQTYWYIVWAHTINSNINRHFPIYILTFPHLHTHSDILHTHAIHTHSHSHTKTHQTLEQTYAHTQSDYQTHIHMQPLTC